MRKLLLGIALLAGLGLVAQAQVQSPNLTVNGGAVNRSTVNGSVTITTGNTFQQILPSVIGSSTAVRQSLTIQNNNTSDSCWIYIGTGTPTTANSIILDTTHGTAYTRFFPYVPSDQIRATCANNSDTLYVDTQ